MSFISSTQTHYDLIAGAVAGSAGIIVGHPFDSLKVRMQMMSTKVSSVSIKGLLQYGSLWKGIGAPITMAAAINASVFLTYGGSTRVWNNYFNVRENNMSFFRDVVCGAVTGFMSSIVTCPTEHIKTKMQVQNKMKSMSAYGAMSEEVIFVNCLHATKHILDNYGIRGLYRGWTATIIRQSPSFIIYFSTYDRLKDVIDAEESFMTSMIAGGIAGSLSWAVVYPIDFVKSRIQAMPLACRNSSMLYVTRQIIREHGWLTFYRGFGVTVFRAFPVNAVIFSTYELVLKTLR